MSAKRVCDMSCGAMHEFALVLDKAGFDADLVQRITNSRGNAFAKAMLASLDGGKVADPLFTSVKKFGIVVPEGYEHSRQLGKFEKEHRKKFYGWNDNITDEHFAKATTMLKPGQKFEVEVFQINETATSLDCMKFLKEQNAVLVGAQGASLVYEQKKDELVKGRWHVSFDKEEALWKDADGYHRVPCVGRCSGGDFGWFLGRFGHAWCDLHCLLVFRDLEKPSVA